MINITPESPENLFATPSSADAEEKADHVISRPSLYSAAFFLLFVPLYTRPSKLGSFFSALFKYQRYPRQEGNSFPFSIKNNRN